MHNFSSLPATQTDLDKFVTIFQENFRVFQENFWANFKKVWFLVLNYICQAPAPASAQTDFDKFLTIFQGNFKIFLKKIQNFPNM
jgi:hypothetical protein